MVVSDQIFKCFRVFPIVSIVFIDLRVFKIADNFFIASFPGAGLSFTFESRDDSQIIKLRVKNSLDSISHNEDGAKNYVEPAMASYGIERCFHAISFLDFRLSFLVLVSF